MELNFAFTKVKINEVLNILHFLVKRAGANVWCSGEEYRKEEH
jgi:hypothetical protein